MHSVYYIFLGFLLCGLVACQEEKTDAEPVGRIRLSLTDQVETKALPDALTPELTDQFSVRMIRKIDNRLVFGGTCADFNTKAQLFKAGEHTIQASYGDNPTIHMDAPYYVSEEKTIIVEGGKEQQVTLQCCVGNALAAFELVNADKLSKVLKDYYIEAVVKGESVKWYPGSSENPYFQAGSKVVFYLKGTWIENGLSYVTDFATLQPVEAGKIYRYKLKFDTSNMTGAILDIEVDAAVENVTVNQTLPPAWLPKPKITADGFDAEHLLAYTETADAATAEINFAAVRPVQDIELTLNFADPNLSKLNKTYVFSSMTAAEKEELQQAAIILPALDETTTSGKVNFSAMTTSLLTLDGGLEADNQIRLRVKANDRWSDEAHYTIKTVKPEFTIEVLEGNIWSKEFKIEECNIVTGNEAKIKETLKYQYSEDGVNWKDCDQQIKFTNLPVNKNFQVRALFRNDIASSNIANVILETPAELVNGDLEEWSAEERGYYYKALGGSSSPKLRTYYPWNTTPFWNTNNNFTTRYRDAGNASFSTVYRYNSFPAVSYTKDVHSGVWAAELRNTAAGRGNTSSSKSNYDFNNVPGELFIGGISVTTNGTAASPSNDYYTIDKGKEFTSRPTALRFWYKYTPYNSDSWKVYIALYDKEKNLIIEKNCTYSEKVEDAYRQVIVTLDYENEVYYNACRYLYIIFSSSVHNGADLPYTSQNVITWYNDSQRTDQTLSGSILKIDDISLIYDK